MEPHEQYARNQLEDAGHRLFDVREKVYDKEEGLTDYLTRVSLQPILSESQIVIETSVKAMFTLVEVEHPKKHGFDFQDDRIEGLLSNVPDGFERANDVPRAIFLTNFWHQFYELAKYGVPELHLTPKDIFSTDDARRAVDDAEFCFDTSYELYQHITDNEIVW